MAWAIVETTFKWLTTSIREIEDVSVIGPFDTREEAMDYYFGPANTTLRELVMAEDNITVNSMNVAIVEMQAPLDDHSR